MINCILLKLLIYDGEIMVKSIETVSPIDIELSVINVTVFVVSSVVWELILETVPFRFKRALGFNDIVPISLGNTIENWVLDSSFI